MSCTVIFVKYHGQWYLFSIFSLLLLCIVIHRTETWQINLVRPTYKRFSISNWQTILGKHYQRWEIDSKNSICHWKKKLSNTSILDQMIRQLRQKRCFSKLSYIQMSYFFRNSSIDINWNQSLPFLGAFSNCNRTLSGQSRVVVLLPSIHWSCQGVRKLTGYSTNGSRTKLSGWNSMRKS